jgi:hypothetical protein
MELAQDRDRWWWALVGAVRDFQVP